MSIKYVKNTDDATIVCKIPSNKKKEFIFRNKKFDKRNNVLLSSGFTEVTEDDLALLRAESNTFKFYEKSGKLSIVDSLPQESMSSEQLVITLRMEISELRKQLKNPAKDDGALNDALGVIEAQKKIIAELEEELANVEVAPEVEELKLEIQKQQDIIDGLQEQLAETVKLDEV